MFDIDKLGLSTINWNVSNGIASDQFEDGSEKYYQNQLIKDFLTLLIDKKSVNILHRSIDNDTKLLTDIIKELENGSLVKEEPYGFYSLSTQTERKNDYITGKIGIGPFALNNNNHILTMLYDVRFKDKQGTLINSLGLTDLSSKEDFEHNSILSWLSALINAHVDIAKDPYISRLNVNPYTYNLVNMLIRTGFGKRTFYFTTQPIMKELARVYMNAQSSYMADKNKSTYQLQKQAIEQLVQERFGEETIGEYTFDQLQKIENPNEFAMRSYINGIFKQLVDNDVIKRNANKSYEDCTGTVVKIGDKDLSLTPNQIQFVVYLANKQFEPYASAVSNLVKYSKIDTKKHGKSYIEQQVYKEGFDDLFLYGNGGLFEKDSLDRMVNGSYLLTKTTNAVSMTRDILKGQFLEATLAFYDAVRYVLAAIGRGSSKDVNLRNRIGRLIMSSIKSEFINDYAKRMHPENQMFIKDLVTESEEQFEYSQEAGSNSLRLNSSSNYDLKSYVGGNAYVTFNGAKNENIKPGTVFKGGVSVISVSQNKDDATYVFRYPIVGADDEMNEIVVPIPRTIGGSGTVRITGGKNTIFDRFDRLFVELKEDYQYHDILDAAGEPINMLLRSLVHGRTFDYTSPVVNYLQEAPDTYPHLKFLKLFNALDQNGVESNYIIDAWDELLHDNKHPLLKQFAEDLVVYAFVTSGDQGGFTKFFKQVPFSWRKESGYGDFIQDKLFEFQTSEINKEQLRDAILNNWFDDDIVRTYYSTRLGKDGKSRIPQFITYSGESAGKGFTPQYHPLILAALTVDEETGVYSPSIDPNSAPMFIKVPRRNEENARDSQRRYTIYEHIDDGMKQAQNGELIKYPIYVKVEPKGNQLRGNYLMTEYGRNDSVNPERTPNREALSKAYKIGDFLERQVVDKLKEKFGSYGDIIEAMNYHDVYIEKYKGDSKAFYNVLKKKNEIESEDHTQLTPEEQKEAEEYKKACEGGKI